MLSLDEYKIIWHLMCICVKLVVVIHSVIIKTECNHTLSCMFTVCMHEFMLDFGIIMYIIINYRPCTQTIKKFFFPVITQWSSFWAGSQPRSVTQFSIKLRILLSHCTPPCPIPARTMALSVMYMNIQYLREAFRLWCNLYYIVLFFLLLIQYLQL